MRKGITNDQNAISDVLTRSEVIHLALTTDDGPYCVPVNFAHVEDVIYIHSGRKGTKMDALLTGDPLAFSAIARTEAKTADKACDFGYKFESVLGTGVPRVVEGDEQRLECLEIIAAKYGAKDLPIDGRVLRATAIIAIHITQATARIKDY